MKRFLSNIKFVLFFTGLVAIPLLVTMSCAPKSQSKKTPSDLRQKQIEFLPLNSDKNLDLDPEHFDIKKAMGYDDAKNAQTPWLDNSADIFRLAENAIVMGDLFKDEKRFEYKKFGHNLLKLFYASKDNATQFDKNTTMYLPAALGFQGEKIMGMFATVGSSENLAKVVSIFNGCSKDEKLEWVNSLSKTLKMDFNHCLVLDWPEQQPTLRPVEFIVSIKQYLKSAVHDFENNNVDPGFVKSFKDQIQKDYMTKLDQAEKDLASAGDSQKLLTNVDQISKVMGSLTFIPQDVLDKILGALEKARVYGVLLDTSQNPDDLGRRLVKVISSIWLDLKQEQREQYIKPANAVLFEKMSKLSFDRLNALAGRQASGYIDNETRDGFETALSESCEPLIHDKLVMWETFDPQQKTEFHEKDPKTFEVFSHYSQKEIQNDILNNYKEKSEKFEMPFFGNDNLGTFIKDFGPLCLANVDDMIDSAANKYVLGELDKQIRSYGDLIEQIVAKTTIGKLQEINDSLSSNDKFVSYFNQKAFENPLVNVMFSQNTINGVENARTQIFVDADGKLNTKVIADGNFQTGAEVIGLSLSANARRMEELSEFENAGPQSSDAYKVVFSQINKMLSMIGFKKFDHSLVPSLHRLFYGKHPQMDLFRYDCNAAKLERQNQMRIENPSLVMNWREDCTGALDFNDDTYAIPDQMAMVEPFVPQDDIYPRTASAAGQAEIVRGASMMLKYFKDWKDKKDDYDLGMGQEKFQNVLIFPRSAFVSLTMGLVTTPIRGFKKPNSPVRLFNSLGGEIQDWVAKDVFTKDPVKVKARQNDLSLQLTEAIVVGFDQKGLYSDVSIKDIAAYIIAMDEFILATEGIAKTKASLINPDDPGRTDHDVLNAVNDGRNQLKLLVYGMSSFLINHMQEPEDGGFWSSYSFQTHTVNKTQPRTLSDQVLVMEALMRVHREWALAPSDVDETARKSTEAYYFINQKLWNETSQFYAVDETNKLLDVPPQLFLNTLMAIHEITPYLNSQSQTQAKKLFDFYSDQFLQWNKSTAPIKDTSP